MKRLLATMIGTLVTLGAWAQMPGLGDVMKGVQSLNRVPGAPAQVGASDDATNAAGIREALAVGTENAVKSLSRPDGYFANEAVKILMPQGIRKVADVARKVGFERQVDEFILSMNRAAEKAAPMAVKFFGDAIRDMSMEDVRGILTGGDTAATDYFSRKTRDKLYAAFKPVVSKSIGEVGATRRYNDLMGRYESVPFMKKQSVDLEDYVTNKGLDGLFHMVAQEERKIRTNPMARTTDLLKTVFGG